jgi:hypothetical protein
MVLAADQQDFGRPVVPGRADVVVRVGVSHRSARLTDPSGTVRPTTYVR